MAQSVPNATNDLRYAEIKENYELLVATLIVEDFRSDLIEFDQSMNLHSALVSNYLDNLKTAISSTIGTGHGLNLEKFLLSCGKKLMTFEQMINELQ